MKKYSLIMKTTDAECVVAKSDDVNKLYRLYHKYNKAAAVLLGLQSKIKYHSEFEVPNFTLSVIIN